MLEKEAKEKEMLMSNQVDSILNKINEDEHATEEMITKATITPSEIGCESTSGGFLGVTKTDEFLFEPRATTITASQIGCEDIKVGSLDVQIKSKTDEHVIGTIPTTADSNSAKIQGCENTEVGALGVSLSDDILTKPKAEYLLIGSKSYELLINSKGDERVVTPKIDGYCIAPKSTSNTSETVNCESTEKPLSGVPKEDVVIKPNKADVVVLEPNVIPTAKVICKSTDSLFDVPKADLVIKPNKGDDCDVVITTPEVTCKNTVDSLVAPKDANTRVIVSKTVDHQPAIVVSLHDSNQDLKEEQPGFESNDFSTLPNEICGPLKEPVIVSAKSLCAGPNKVCGSFMESKEAKLKEDCASKELVTAPIEDCCSASIPLQGSDQVEEKSKDSFIVPTKEICVESFKDSAVAEKISNALLYINQKKEETSNKSFVVVDGNTSIVTIQDSGIFIRDAGDNTPGDSRIVQIDINGGIPRKPSLLEKSIGDQQNILDETNVNRSVYKSITKDFNSSTNKCNRRSSLSVTDLVDKSVAKVEQAIADSIINIGEFKENTRKVRRSSDTFTSLHNNILGHHRRVFGGRFNTKRITRDEGTHNITL